MNREKLLWLAAGFLAGAGTVCFVRGQAGRKAAVAIASKGLELKERVEALTERVKETAEDVVAEAKYVNEQKASPAPDA
jgi:gas vesicle protein